MFKRSLSKDMVYMVSKKSNRCILTLHSYLKRLITCAISHAHTRNKKDISRGILDGRRGECSPKDILFTKLLRLSSLPCPLSTMPMTHIPGKWNSFSINRIDDALGYTCDNIELCSAVFNSNRISWTPNKLYRLKNLVRYDLQHVDILEIKTNYDSINDKSRAPRKQRTYTWNNILPTHPTHASCHGDVCNGKLLLMTEFYKNKGKPYNIHSLCKTCIVEYFSKFSVFMRTLIYSARSNSKFRSRVQSRSLEDHSFHLQLHDVYQMYLEQKGLCHYSDKKMIFKPSSTDWQASLERLDNTQGYSKNNCVLVCHEFNGRSQMSRSILDQVLQHY